MSYNPFIFMDKECKTKPERAALILYFVGLILTSVGVVLLPVRIWWPHAFPRDYGAVSLIGVLCYIPIMVIMRRKYRIENRKLDREIRRIETKILIVETLNEILQPGSKPSAVQSRKSK